MRAVEGSLGRLPIGEKRKRGRSISIFTPVLAQRGHLKDGKGKPDHPPARGTRTIGRLEVHPRWSCAPGTRALRRSMRGQTRQSPVLVQRAVSEDPRWTRALGTHLACPQGEGRKSGALDGRT